MTETEFEKKLAAYNAKQAAPYKVPKSKMNGVQGGAAAGKRMDRETFDKFLVRSRTAYRREAIDNQTVLTPAQQRERKAGIDAWVAANRERVARG